MLIDKEIESSESDTMIYDSNNFKNLTLFSQSANPKTCE